MQDQMVAVPNTINEPDYQALLVFSVGGQLYSLAVSSVARIIEMVTIKPLPNAPKIIQGLINLQGKVVPVIDLRLYFGLTQPSYGLHTPIILVEMNDAGRLLGLIVDRVEDVIQIDQTDLELTEAFTPAELVDDMAVRAAHIAGVAKVGPTLIPMLTVQSLLSQTEQQTLRHVVNE